MSIRKRLRWLGALVVVVLALTTAGCGNDEPMFQRPTPPAVSLPAPTPTVTTTETAEPSPQPTVTVTETATTDPEPTEDEPESDEPSDDETAEVPPRPEAIDETIYLSGPIILVNRAERADGSCTDRITDVVVNVSADDDEGIKLAHIRGRIGLDSEHAALDRELRVGISPDNLENKLTLLERGESKFPEASDLTHCDDIKDPDVLEPFYGQWIVKGLPYNAETWFNL